MKDRKATFGRVELVPTRHQFTFRKEEWPSPDACHGCRRREEKRHVQLRSQEADSSWQRETMAGRAPCAVAQRARCIGPRSWIGYANVGMLRGLGTGSDGGAAEGKDSIQIRREHGITYGIAKCA